MVRKNKLKTEPVPVEEPENTEELAISPPKIKKKKKKNKKQDAESGNFSEVWLESGTDIKSEVEDSHNDTTSCTETIETSSMYSDDIPKKKKKKKKKLTDEETVDFPDVEEMSNEKINGVIVIDADKHVKSEETSAPRTTWPKEKLDRLINQMEATLPKNDTLKYSSRLGRLDWKAVSFDEYSPEECHEMWRHIQTKIRCYRILKEILDEARTYVEKEAIILQKNHDHPGMPTKPLSSFMLFYRDTKEKVLTESPRLSITEISKKISELWKSLSPKKLEKYKNKALKLRQEYEEKLKIFYQEHPDVEPPVNKKSRPKSDALGFAKPRSAFQLFHQAMRAKYANSVASELLEKCKTKWKNMSEKKKVAWIEAAQQEEEIYKENLKRYQSEHPDYVPPPIKTLITKSDKHILNNISGRPKPPPRNAYSLYSQESLQNGSLKEIQSKDRLAEISKRWRALAQFERDAYSAKCEQMQKEYKIEYQKFMDSLPPEKKLEELQKQPKRKRPESKDASKAKKIKVSEPAKPPESAFELFKQKNENQWDKSLPVSVDYQAQKKWKKLSTSEKQIYSDEVQKLKDSYLTELTDYLQHCPPDKLAHYVAIIASHQQKQFKKETASSEDSELDSDSD